MLISTEIDKRKRQTGENTDFQQASFWMSEFGKLRQNVDELLLNNMNTRGVILQIQSILTAISKSMLKSSKPAPLAIYESILLYCKQWLHDVGFVDLDQSTGELQQGVIDTFCEFRKSVRDSCLHNLQEAKDHSSASSVDLSKQLLKECDGIRTRMSDKHKITIIDGKEGLLWVAGELPKKKEEKKPTEKKQGLVASIPPSEMFRQSGEYSSFDERGIPTCDKDGKPLSASRIKKLTKQYNTHKAIHEKWLASKK